LFAYYTLVTAICCFALFALCVLVRDNDRLRREDKRLFYLTYLLIAVSAMAEWLGVWLDGREGLPQWPLLLAKCADYVLTPLAGGTLVGQMRLRNRWHRALMGILAFNALFQIFACPFGWMVKIDAGNHYSRGPLYGVYIAVYVAVIAIIAIEFVLYGKTFRRQNRHSLYVTMLLVLLGIGLHEAFGKECRTVYLSLTGAAMLLFIHFAEFSQLKTDDFVAYQRTQLSTDPLTGLQSRYSYVQTLKEYDSAAGLPDDLAAFVVDINWLKEVNDTEGHEAGDELIQGTARCIEKAFGRYGHCYRTGGDEFVVLANLDRGKAGEALEGLAREAGAWTGARVRTLSVSAGFAHAADHPGLTCRELVDAADREMYAQKTEYYRASGHDRRARRG